MNSEVSYSEHKRAYENPALTVQANEHVDQQFKWLQQLLGQLRITPQLSIIYVDADRYDALQGKTLEEDLLTRSTIVMGITPTLTPDGLQFGLSSYSHGLRGSGAYYKEGESTNDLLADALKRLRHYHRSTSLTFAKPVDHSAYQFRLAQLVV